MIIHRDIIQGSEEWHKIRELKLTASHGTAIANNGAGLKTYVKDLVIRVIAPQQDNFTSKDMERGNLLEPIARTMYEFENNLIVEEVGFIEHCSHSGYSPDGLIGEDGLLEIKARNDAKHYNLLTGGLVSSDTRWQMQFGLMVTGREWCDFVSYNPNFKSKALFVKRFYRDEKLIEKLKIGLEAGIKMLKLELDRDFVKNELLKLK